MIYKVLLDGVDIYNEDYSVQLISPSLSMELNSAGSFTFTMPPTHKYYDMPKLLVQTVDIFEGDQYIWSGRIMEIKKDFHNAKEIYCEGALGFFNDSLQRPKRYLEIDILEFFNTLIENHNSQVPENRQFTVGNVDVESKIVFRQLDYQTTFECLQDMCVNAEGGHLIVRKEDGVNYIDWIKAITDISNQPAQFGLNILDFNQVISGADIATCIVPIGQGGNGGKLTIKYINNDIDYLESDAIETYGRITKMVEFDVSQRDKLLEEGKKWLKDTQWDPLSISVDVAELSYLEPTFNGFRVGQIVHCVSNPHLIDKNFPILSISLDLNSAKKQITIGTTPPKTLTEITRTGTKTYTEEVIYD